MASRCFSDSFDCVKKYSPQTQLGVSPTYSHIMDQRGCTLQFGFLRLGVRIWFAGDGAFAPESWVGSAIQPYPAFGWIRVDSRAKSNRACIIWK